MDAHLRGLPASLPSCALSILARLQLTTEELLPEAPGSLGVVRGKLDE
jgi:hypothetical protein